MLTEMCFSLWYSQLAADIWGNYKKIQWISFLWRYLTTSLISLLVGDVVGIQSECDLLRLKQALAEVHAPLIVGALNAETLTPRRLYFQSPSTTLLPTTTDLGHQQQERGSLFWQDGGQVINWWVQLIVSNLFISAFHCIQSCQDDCSYWGLEVLGCSLL